MAFWKKKNDDEDDEIMMMLEEIQQERGSNNFIVLKQKSNDRFDDEDEEKEYRRKYSKRFLGFDDNDDDDEEDNDHEEIVYSIKNEEAARKKAERKAAKEAEKEERKAREERIKALREQEKAEERERIRLEEEMKAEEERLEKELEEEEKFFGFGGYITNSEPKEEDERVTEDKEIKIEINVVEVPGYVEDVQAYLGDMDYKYVIGWRMEDGDVDTHFYSKCNEIRAAEFLDFLVHEYDKATGDAVYANAKISKLVFKVMLSDVEENSVNGYFNRKIEEYYKECDWMYTEGMVNYSNVENMDKYKKKKIPWAFVRSIDILPKGESFRIRMLENESEIELISSDGLYIMIGLKGEIYNITEEKFITTYTETKEEFDICETMPIYLPAIYACSSGKKISIDDKAHLCYPKDSRTIYAKPIEKRTKVFSVYNKGEYFVGKPGDYLVIREDDVEDVYIVQKEIFEETYNKIN